MQGTCIVCLQDTDALHMHHWPHTRRYGDLTVPVCPYCHTALHHGIPIYVDTLAMRAPAYWIGTGEWEQAAPIYRNWILRQNYIKKGPLYVSPRMAEQNRGVRPGPG